MVPWYNIVFLVLIIIMSAIIMNKQYDYKVKNKNFELLFDLFIYFIFGLSFGMLLFQGVFVWWAISFYFLFGILSDIIFLITLNRKGVLYNNVKYTADELIGQTGYLITKQGDNRWYGKLLDENKTDIILTIENKNIDIRAENIFEITEIRGNEIIGKIIN